MLSAIYEKRLDDLHEVQNDYTPGAQTIAEMAAKDLWAFVGPTCVGKNATMEALVSLDPALGICRTRTSRPPRTTDRAGLYTYYEHTDQGITQVLSDIEDSRVLQYAVNPHSHFVYCSYPDDYPAAHNLGDFFANAVDGLDQLGFNQTAVFDIITEPDILIPRFHKRFPAGDPQRQARRSEAIDSLEWSLAQTRPNHYWIANVGPVETAAQEVLAVADGTSQGSRHGAALARACLEALQEMDI